MAGDIALRRQQIRQTTGDNSQKESRVTITHKSNVLSQTDGLFRQSARTALEHQKYQSAGVKVDEQIIDSMFYKLGRDPSPYDVIVAPNLYGDLLSGEYNLLLITHA